MELTEKIKCVQLFKGFSCDEVSYICISILIYIYIFHILYIVILFVILWFFINVIKKFIGNICYYKFDK